MSELMKDMFNYDSLRELGLAVQSVYEPFDVDGFLKFTMDETWQDLELKARARQINKGLGKYLPKDYETAIGILDKVVVFCNSAGRFCFPDFVELYGQEEKYWDFSIGALERYTQYFTSEFAVHPFIIADEERMMAQMLKWSKHENEHVRRLASEGCRPQLPWGQALNSFKKDPTPVLPILENLKRDPSPYVRKSVANNLNDISKTHPELVEKLAKQWHGKDERTDWIVKHGCRTLLKKGNREVLAIFGYEDDRSIGILDFALNTTEVSIGEALTFSFVITTENETKVRLEYGIDYVKANGKRNRKMFQISEIALKKKEKKTYVKSHSFKDMSTRRHYAGTHSITLIVNGRERGTLDFELTE